MPKIMWNKSVAFAFILCNAAFLLGSAQTWKDVKHLRTSALKSLNSPTLDPERLNYFGNVRKDEAHFAGTFQQILRVRTPGSQGSLEVRQAIESQLADLGWEIEEDSFRQNTVVGPVSFTNIIATLDPAAPRRMVLACHYDSKISPSGFLGATDSAVPCAQMINLAYTLKAELDRSKSQMNQLTLQFIFFDGEEAFKRWSSTDSLYGSRHLAALWQQTPYEFQQVGGNILDRIDIFVLLDLLGARNPSITSHFRNTESWFNLLMSIESGIAQNGIFTQRRGQIFKKAGLFGTSSIDDDHKPFLRRGVPIMHVIASPFPDVWHTSNDNANAVDYPTVEKLNMILRIFVAEYLNL